MDTLVTALLVFFEKHRRCGKLDGGMERGMIWMTCARCDTCLVLDTMEPRPPTC